MIVYNRTNLDDSQVQRIMFDLKQGDCTGEKIYKGLNGAPEVKVKFEGNRAYLSLVEDNQFYQNMHSGEVSNIHYV